MNTKLIMTCSAAFLAVVGISLTFAPKEIASLIDVNVVSTSTKLLFQILGALFFGFAILNWMAKGSIIGGIYNRPISIANFSHYLIGSLALIKALQSNPSLPYLFWVIGGIYTVFAILFGIIFKRHPKAA